MKNVSLVSIIRKSSIDKKARVLSFTKVYNSEIDRYSYVGRGSEIINTMVGKFCSIASGTKIGVADHPTSWVSSSPVFCSGKNILKKNFSQIKFEPYKKTIIGNDVWIGSNVIVKGGVVIGDGVIIGAGAVVTKDIPPYTIVGGVPAKNIRKRFNDNQIEQLLKIKWWELSEERLAEIAHDFDDVNKVISYLSEEL